MDVYYEYNSAAAQKQSTGAKVMKGIYAVLMWINVIVCLLLMLYILFTSVVNGANWKSKIGNFLLALFFLPIYVLKYMWQCQHDTLGV